MCPSQLFPEAGLSLEPEDLRLGNSETNPIPKPNPKTDHNPTLIVTAAFNILAKK